MSIKYSLNVLASRLSKGELVLNALSTLISNSFLRLAGLDDNTKILSAIDIASAIYL